MVAFIRMLGWRNDYGRCLLRGVFLGTVTNLLVCHDVSGLLETVQPDTAPQYCELKHRNGRISPESPVLSVSE